MREELPARTKLARGQVERFYASRETVIAVSQGRICVQPAPSWIGEQLVQEQFIVVDGEAHIVQQSGWLAVHAHADAEIVCSPGRESIAAQTSRLFSFASALLRRWKFTVQESNSR